MPKKNDELVTKQILVDALRGNSADLKKWTEGKLIDQTEKMQEWMNKKLDETYLKFKDEIMTAIDKWAGISKKYYEETEIISPKVTSNEERIGKLETAVFNN